jgi:hypothetical protein
MMFRGVNHTFADDIEVALVPSSDHIPITDSVGLGQ